MVATGKASGNAGSRAQHNAASCPRRSARLLVTLPAAGIILFAIWAAPTAAASTSVAAGSSAAALARTAARGHAAAVAVSSRKVKYYIIPAARKGTVQSLYSIALRTLGDGQRFTEIFDLNKGRLQPGGGRLRDPSVVRSGWILQLPADAQGPGVHFGPLPGPKAKAPKPQQSPAPASPSAATAAPAASGGSLSAVLPVLAGGGLLVLAAAGLMVGRRRRAGGGAVDRRRPSHAKGAAGRVTDRRRGDLTDLPGQDAFGPGPGPAIGRPADLGGTDSRWPGGSVSTAWPPWDPPAPPADDRRLPAAQRGPQNGGPQRGPGGNGGGYRGTPLAAPAGATLTSPPPAGPGEPQRWPAHAAPAGAAAQAQTQTRSPAPGMPGRPAQGMPPGMAPGMGPGMGMGGQPPGAVTMAPGNGMGIRPRRDDPYGNDLQVVLNEAPAATRVRRPQSLVDTAQENYRLVADEAAELWRQPPGPGSALQATAQQEAAEIRRQAIAQATAIRTTAEREAAELRTATVSMSAELLRVARYVTDSLSSVVSPDSIPGIGRSSRPPRGITDGGTTTADPAGRTATRQAPSPTARPARKPAALPSAEPATQPDVKPDASTKGRQVGNWRKALVALTVVILVGAATGTAEVAAHGFKFFLFRNTGAGAGNSQDLEENQGPGQPDAPGTHHAKIHKPATTPGKPGKPGNAGKDKKPGKSK
ncbi:MAG: hypothetical protein ABJB47_02945 [Actinomycetota bacterium]